MTPTAKAAPGAKLLTPKDHALVLIDFQPKMAFATHSTSASELRANGSLISQAAAGFGVSTVLTTVVEKSFSSPMFDEITALFPGQKLLDRKSMNVWEDAAVIEEINRIAKQRIVLAGLWTSVCIVGPALSALDQGFDVYVIADACGDVSAEAHNRAMERMVQAGAQPMTALQYMLELRHDWERGDVSDSSLGATRGADDF